MMLQSLPNKWVKNVVKLCGLVTWCLLTGLWVGSRPVQAADAVVGTGTAASCNEGAFDAALFSVQNGGGGTITFNCGPGIQIIDFFAGSTGKIINTPVVIDAPDKLAVFNGEIVLNAYNERRHFYVEANGSLTLKNITLIQGFNNTGGGGSIYNLGTLILEGATILDSNVDVNRSGGAILSSGGPVTITNSRLENNTGGSVGGLYLVGESADATITNSIFRNNRTTNTTYGLGGAITTWDGADVIIHTSTLQGNQARQGGAIYNNFAATTITIDTNSKVITNTATLTGGAISNVFGTITISNSTLAGNAAQAGDGGGINNSGTLSISNSTLFSNSVSANHNGGAISSSGGSVTLTDSRLEDNGAGSGGGLYLIGETADATITNSTFRNNRTTNNESGRGGAITTWSGADITIRSSTLQGNQARDGGAIYNNAITSTVTIEADTKLLTNTAMYDGGGILNDGTLTISNSTLSGNSADRSGGGGILNDGTLTISNSTLSGNSAQFGGGIYNSRMLTVSNSTFSGNSAPFGGAGIYNDVTLTVSNSTFSGNSAPFGGGGIINYGSTTIRNSTFSHNSADQRGGGIFNASTLTVSNSIIANSPMGGDCGGNIINDGHNLIEDNSCGFSGGSDPKLGPLQDNGGPTFTHALLAGSPAINRGASTLASDQRGVPRPQGSAADIGAFELVYANSAPVANTQTVTMPVDTAKAITLTASDADNDVLTYTITSNPLSGTLSGAAPNVIYTPKAGFRGSDSFTFRVHDGTVDSAPAVVTILVGEQGSSNHAPVADAQTVTTLVNTAKGITLTGSDADNDVLTYTVTISPTHGTLSGTASNLTYTPNAGFRGSDSFSFRVHDGKLASAPAVVTILVEEQGNSNHPPVANAQTVTTPVNTAKAITLTGSDADNNALTYTITSNPLSGTLSGTAPNVTYTPKAGFRGSDSFTFRVNDGKVDSDAAAVTITIEGQGNSNHPPIAVADAVTTTAGVTITISVLANDADPDGDALTVTINQQPQHGSAVVNGGAIIYKPSANFSGADSFSYTITDSQGATASATITITVKAQGNGATLYLPVIRKP